MPLTISSTKLIDRPGSAWVTGDAVRPLLSATGATGTVTFSDGGAGGTFETVSTTSAYYNAPNQSRQVVITGTDSGAGGMGTKTIQIYGTFPLQPNRGFETTFDNETKMRRARGGTRYFREDYVTEIALSIACERRGKDETKALRDFWARHRKVVPFYYFDVTTDVLAFVRFESGLVIRFESACWWTLTAGVKGDFAYSEILEIEPGPPDGEGLTHGGDPLYHIGDRLIHTTE